MAAAMALVGAKGRPFWFDELSTLLVASQPSIGAYFRIEGVDAQPPVLASLVRAASHLPLSPEVNARLPSLLGLLLAGWAIFFFIDRKGMRLAASAAAVSFFLGSSLNWAGESRPYGLAMGLTGVVLVCWQRSARETKRGWWLTGLAVSLALLTLTFPFGFLCGGIPVVCAEFVRWRERRAFDWNVAIATGVGLLPVLFIFWLSAQVKVALLNQFHGINPLVARPSLGNLAASVIFLVRSTSIEILLIAVILRLLPIRKREKQESDLRAFRPWEWAAVAGVFLTVFAIWGMAVVYTHYYFARYGCVTLVATSLAFGMCLSLRGSVGRDITALIAASLICVVFGRGLVRQIREGSGSPADRSSAAALAPLKQVSEPIVISSALSYQQVGRYTSAELRPNLIFVSEPAAALRTRDFVPEFTILTYRNLGVLPLPIADYAAFVREHERFYLLTDFNSSEYLPGLLEQAGYRKTQVSPLNTRLYHYQR